MSKPHIRKALRQTPDGRTIIDSPAAPYSAVMGHVFITNHGVGDTHILDMRGWGFLTGSGWAALGLPDTEAARIQDDTLAWIVEAMNEKRERETGEKRANTEPVTDRD